MTRRIWLGISGGALALILTTTLLTGAAFAQEGDDETSLGQQFVERLAGKLGITSDELKSAVQETQLEMVDEALANGRLTEQQAAEMRERIESGEGRFGFPHRGGHGPRHALFGHGQGLEVVAETLGLTQAALVEQLTSGATLTEVIVVNGSTVEAVVDALVAHSAEKLDAAVVAGRITQARADEILAALPERLSEAIESGRFCPPHFQQDDAETTETSNST